MTYRRSSVAVLAAVAALMLAFSCASPPKPIAESAPPAPPPAKAEAAPPPAPATAEAVPAPAELRAKAAELKKKAFDLGLKEVLPEAYAEADRTFAEGVASYGEDNAASAASLSESVSRFEALIAEGLPILSAAEKKRAEGLRDLAQKKGAPGIFADLSAFADAEFSKPVEAESAGDYEFAIKGFKASSALYSILYKLCDANTAREAMLARDFPKWDTSDWNQAENRFKASQDLLSHDVPAAAASVDEALLRYGIAYSTALGYYASDRRQASEAERDRAAGIKAGVAVKDEYDAALELHSKAEAAQAAKDLDGSAALYGQAAEAFGSAYVHAKTKMDGAKLELDSLDAAIAARGVQ
jgi:hypothetical protein